MVNSIRYDKKKNDKLESETKGQITWYDLVDYSILWFAAKFHLFYYIYANVPMLSFSPESSMVPTAEVFLQLTAASHSKEICSHAEA